MTRLQPLHLLVLLGALAGLAWGQSPFTLSVSPSSPSTYGQNVTLTATGSGLTSGQTITFIDGSTTLGTATANANSTAVFPTSKLAVGTHSLQATYPGPPTNSAGLTIRSNTVSYVVNQASTTLSVSSSPDPSNFGQNVLITAVINASVSGETGTVTFFDGSNELGANTVNSSGFASFQTSTLTVGTHFLNANYGGDTNFGSSSGRTTQTVNRAPTTTTISSSPNPSVFGQTVTLTATVAAGATGSVTFFDGQTTLGTSALSTDGIATFQTSTLAVGAHTLTATYAGDNNYTASTSKAITQTVNKFSTRTTLTASPNPVNSGSSVTLTASVSQSTGATGTVTFFDGTNPIGTAALSGGTATTTTSTLAVGSHSLTATYNGDTNNATSTSAVVTLVVNQVSTATSTSLAATPNPASLGQTVTLLATVTPSSATGAVTFRDGTNPIGTATLINGAATFTTSSLAIGSHTLTAVYGGDAANTSSTSAPITEVVNKAPTTTSLTATPNPATVGQAVTLVATVSPSNATGTVTFVDGTNPIGTAPLNGGTAVLTTSSLAAGSHTLSATFSGDNNFSGSTSGAVAFAVGQGSTATSLSVFPNPQNSGQPVTLNAVVIPTSATGTVTFKDSGATLATVNLVNGSATFSTATLTVGSHSLTATYSGDNTFSSSTSNTISEVINQATTTTTTTLSVSPNPATAGQPVTLNAVVVPTSATGTVTFSDGNTTIGTATLAGGSANFTVSGLTVGSHSLTASYGGDTADSPSTSSAITEIINAGNVTVTLASSPNPANFGQTVTLTITVSPASSTGTVTVFDSVTAGPVGGTATLSNGSATITVSTLKVGSHALQAFYSGPSNLSAQSSLVTETINAAPTTTTLSVSSTLLTATVTPSGATGTVTFKDGSTNLGAATLSNGTAIFTATSLSSGNHTLTATYSGDGNYAPSTSNPVSITPGLTTTTTTLAVSPASSTPGQTVTLTATVTPSTATGTVTFLDGSATLGTATLSGGTATLTTTKLTSGTHTLTASYGGDSSDGPSTSTAVTETVGLTATKTVLTASPSTSTVGQTVTLTAVVTPSTATGTVTFLDGSTTLGTATLSGGTATLTTSKLTAGAHTLTASYGGDANDAPSTSAAVTETVSAGTPLTISPSTLPLAFVGVAYSQTFTSTGGNPPVTWIAGPNTGTFVPGAVDGLTMSAGGVLSGTPTATGTFSIGVRVTDSAGSANGAVLTLTVVPALPPISITVAQPTTITDQPVPQVSLTGYPVALNATYRLTFTSTPSLGAGYTAVQFVSGGTTVAVPIPANSTAAVPLIAIQQGSVAGTITVQLASLTVAGTGQSVPLPSPVPSGSFAVPRLAPIIVPGSVKITNVTSSGFQVFLDASSTPRDLTSANFTFTAASGSTLNGTSFTVSLTSTATPWFDPANATGVANGGAFSLTFPFTFSGSTSALGTVSVTLTNSVGTSAAVSGGQ